MKIYFMLLVVLLFARCSNTLENNNNKIDSISIIEVNEQRVLPNILLDSIATDIRYLLFETSETLIFSIEDMRVVDNTIFIHDKLNSRILVFDFYSGELLSEIQRQGMGPEEYSDIDFFDINQREETVNILDIRGGTVYKYSYNGKFKEAIKTNIICRDFSVNEDGSFLLYSPDEENLFIDDRLIQPGLIHLSSDGSNARNIQNIGDKRYYPVLGSGKSLVGLKNSFYLFTNYNDTIYQVKTDSVINKMYIKYNNGIDENILLDFKYDMSKLSFPFLKLKPFVSKDYFGYTFMYKESARSILYNRKNGNAQVYDRLKNNINKMPFVFNGKVNRSGDFYICIIDELMIDVYREMLKADGLDSKQKASIEETIYHFNKTGNPILAIAKLN